MRKLSLLLGLLLILAVPAQAVALSQEQKNLYDSGIYYFDESSGGSSCSVVLSGSQNAEKIFNFFISKGLTAIQAAGIIGNMTAESGLEPQRLQGTPPGTITPAETFSGDGGWGIVQWTPGSKFINTNNPISNANDLGVQLEFLWNQLNGTGPLSEKQAGDDIKSTSTIEDAVRAFQGDTQIGGHYVGFERPKDESASLDFRISAARGILAQYGSEAPGSVQTSDSCGSGAVTNVSPDPGFKINKLSDPLSTPGGQIVPKGITLHWWGDITHGQDINTLVSALRGNTSCGSGGCSVQIGITADGQVYQMTNSLTDLTYHATGANNTTIGIEIGGTDSDFGAAGIKKYPAKFNAVVNTVKFLVKKYNIPLDGQVACGDVSGIHPHKAYNQCPLNGQPQNKTDIDDTYFNAVMQQVRAG
ncbi:MAG TPA: phage tail tip lysozyme [Candidatus Saccharimonadales bacterium]|nr:phage tail tip lysozyme [Candidatus Saccharimonadales bacterium]